MSNQVTRELLAMAVRIGTIAAILGAFYATVGVGDTAQILAIGAAAAFGSQAAAFTVRRVAGDRRGKPVLIAIFLAIAVAATIYVVATAPTPKTPAPAPAPATGAGAAPPTSKEIGAISVAELSAGPADRYQDKAVRMHGVVAVGSRTADGFKLSDLAPRGPTWIVRLPVQSPLIQDGAHVIVTGTTRWEGDLWLFMATAVEPFN